MTATPRTDAIATGIIGFYSCGTVPADFARTLETENAAMRLERDQLKTALYEMAASFGKRCKVIIKQDELIEPGDLKDTWDD